MLNRQKVYEVFVIQKGHDLYVPTVPKKYPTNNKKRISMRASLLSHLGSNVVCKSQQAFSSIISNEEMEHLKQNYI